MNHIAQKLAIGAVALALPFTVAACSNSDDGDTAQSADTTAGADMGGGDMGDDETMETDGTDTPEDMTEAFGPGCAAVPDDGDGSFAGMAQDPVATAASNNPALSTLVTAVMEADLVDTLNNTDDITVFAPTDDAFADVPEDTMDAAMDDPMGLLADVLQNHVVSGRLGPDDLAGEHETLGGGTITVEGSGEDFTVDGEAMVVCGNVQTANATVYLIDGVLLPN